MKKRLKKKFQDSQKLIGTKRLTYTYARTVIRRAYTYNQGSYFAPKQSSLDSLDKSKKYVIYPEGHNNNSYYPGALSFFDVSTTKPNKKYVALGINELVFAKRKTDKTHKSRYQKKAERLERKEAVRRRFAH